jgi:hypothetical protein
LPFARSFVERRTQRARSFSTSEFESSQAAVSHIATLILQNRGTVTQALERIRQAARLRKKEQFTALFHHINPELLRAAFFAIKQEAAPGVDAAAVSGY